MQAAFSWQAVNWSEHVVCSHAMQSGVGVNDPELALPDALPDVLPDAPTSEPLAAPTL
jgi:hypothetical protein